MAKTINAIAAYGPKIKLGRMVTSKELISLISGRTGLNKGDIQQMISELHEAIVFYHLAGRSVKIDGLGVYSPKISLDGKFSVSTRIDSEIRADLNKKKGFEGQIENRDMIGKTLAELVTRWNEEHPANLIQ